MNECYVEYLDYYKPENSIPVNVVLDKIDYEQKNRLNYVIKYSKINNVAVENRFNYLEMCEPMIEKYFNQNNPEDIDFLIFSGKEYFVNNGISLPYYFISKFGMKNAGMIALNQGCSGTPQAMELARYMIGANPKLKIMLVSLCLVENEWERYEWPTVMGDGAAMMVMGNNGFLKILDCLHLSDGSMSLERYKKLCEPVQANILEWELDVMKKAKAKIRDILAKNNMTKDDMALFITQNVHYLLLRMQAKNINIKMDKIFSDNMYNGGHLGDVDSIRNLKDAVEKYNGKKGERLLMYILGEMGDNFNIYTILLELA